MTPSVLATGICATILGVVMTTPQALRVWRRRSTEGISLPMWLLMALSTSAWAGYGLATGNHILAASNIVVVLQILVLLCLTMVLSDRIRLHPIPGGITMALGCSVSSCIGFYAPPAVIVCLLMAPPVIRLGQVHASWRTVRTRGKSEVSISSWSLSSVQAALWTVNGALVDDLLLMWISAAVVVTALLVISLELAAAWLRDEE